MSFNRLLFNMMCGAHSHTYALPNILCNTNRIELVVYFVIYSYLFYICHQFIAISFISALVLCTKWKFTNVWLAKSVKCNVVRILRFVVCTIRIIIIIHEIANIFYGPFTHSNAHIFIHAHTHTQTQSQKANKHRINVRPKRREKNVEAAKAAGNVQGIGDVLWWGRTNEEEKEPYQFCEKRTLSHSPMNS